jgi:hypothetical protein
MRLPIRNTGRGDVPAFSARYNVERVSPSRIAVSSTLSRGRGDFGEELSRMDVHRSCAMPCQAVCRGRNTSSESTSRVVVFLTEDD